MSQASRAFRPVPIRPAREASLAVNSIPRPLTSFVGRDPERREIAALLDDPKVRLLSLVGPGGVGKTRLAIQIAEDLSSRYDLVAFVSLATLTDPNAIVPAIAQAVGVREPSVERIVEQLDGIRALLILDNLEQIPNVAPLLAALLSACGSLTVLSTSRAVLRVSGESIVPVLPFAIPSTAASLPFDELAEASALQLFSSRARSANPAFQLSESTIQVVAQICDRLDGLPLAIELAAAQMRMLTPQALLSRLDHRLEVLANGPDDQPARLQTMRSAIRWSYDLLSDEQQHLFRKLGVFAAGFTEEAINSVCRESLPPGERSLSQLAGLIDASLLMRSVQADGESRYFLLETIREFCLSELARLDELSTARSAHATYYLDLTAKAEPQLIVVGSAAWVARLSVEQANLREAVSWSLEAGHAEPVLRLAGTLLSLAYARGEPAESLQWLERALAIATEPPPELKCSALFAAAALAQVQGDFDKSILLATESLDTARSAGYRFGEGRALLGLGITAEWQEDLALAADRYHASLAIMEGLDAPHPLAHWTVLPLANLADIALIRHDHRTAIEFGQQAVDRWRAAGYLWGIAQALGTVAAAYVETGAFASAQSAYLETLELWIACADGRGIAGTIAGIAGLSLAHGDADQAALLLGAAWKTREKLDVRFVAHHLYAEQVIAMTRARLNVESFASSWESGWRLSIENAIAESRRALSHIPEARSRSNSLGLTSREREVLKCVVNGMHDRQIAETLSISPRTVQSHVAGILTKLQANSRAEASAIAVRSGLA